MINFKKSRTAIEIASLDKSNLFIRHITCTNKKITCMTHVVNIDSVTGH